MSAGTITLTNNSDLVVGVGTMFTSDLAAGDIIVAVVGGVTYTLPVKSIESDTTATLVKAYDGPTQAGSAWTAVPRDTLSAITAQLGAEAARAIRGFNYDKQNWQQVFSEAKDITVTLPDGSTFDGPSWLKVVELLREIDLDTITAIAQSVNADAQQVSTDKDIVVAASESASASAAAAANSESSASSSAAAAGNSATAAANSESNAASSAASAKADADRAAAANPDKALLKEHNLSDLASVPDALENLGLSEAATKTDGAVPIEQGGTGATTAETARENLGLGAFTTYGITYTEADKPASVELSKDPNNHPHFIVKGPKYGYEIWNHDRVGTTTVEHRMLTVRDMNKIDGVFCDLGMNHYEGAYVEFGLTVGVPENFGTMLFKNNGQLYIQSSTTGATHYPDGNITGSIWAGWNLRGELNSSGVSDRNHKVFIEPTKVDPMDYIRQMEFVQFGWKYDMYPYKDTTDVALGVIAQNLQDIDPALVTTRPDGTLAADVLQAAVVALAAAKQLNERVTKLEEELAAK